MKALCVRQPWGELIARGIKTEEVRTWWSTYRGPLLICASGGAIDPANRPLMRRYGLTDADCPRGVAVCLVDLVDVTHYVEDGESDAACCYVEAGDQCFELARPQRVEPIRLSRIEKGERRNGGTLNIFEFGDPELIRVAR